MKTTIQQKLKHIELEHKVKILYACESGSRAWGFPSPDSDYDVRFVYAKSMDSYLSIHNEKDFMDFPLSSELDINAWGIIISSIRLLMNNLSMESFAWNWIR